MKDTYFKTKEDNHVPFKGFDFFVPAGTRVVAKHGSSGTVYYIDDLSFFNLDCNKIKHPSSNESIIRGMEKHDATYYGMPINPQLLTSI